jgi:hypothetical protein
MKTPIFIYVEYLKDYLARALSKRVSLQGSVKIVFSSAVTLELSSILHPRYMEHVKALRKPIYASANRRVIDMP